MAREPRYTGNYPLLPPGIYKVRKCGDNPRGLEISKGQYEGHRIILPPQFEMPTGDALVHIAVVKAQKIDTAKEAPTMTKWEYASEHCSADNINRVLERSGLEGWEAWFMEGIARQDGHGGYLFGSIIYFKRELWQETPSDELPYDPLVQDPYLTLAQHFNMPRERMKQLILDAVKPKAQT